MTSAVPCRDDAGTTRGARRLVCAVCTVVFVPAGRQRYCSPACRKRAFRRRHASPAPVAAGTAPRRQRTVYECDGCGARRVGEQRCPDCGTFARAVGLGGDCPHCAEPVTAADLGLIEVAR